MSKTRAHKKDEAITQLEEAGAYLARQEDRHGDTKSGWWVDDVWIGPTADPEAALRNLRGQG